MEKLILVILPLLLISYGNSFSQHIFPDAYIGCNTDRFTMESDSTIAKIDDAELLQVLKSGFSNKAKEKIKGKLSLQLIIDAQGNSCLISLKNETNIRTKKLKLKETIDTNLKWNRPDRKVAVILILDFEGPEVTFTRFGMNKEKGVHVLKN
ncbi:MAG: hypothetical protein ACNS60_18300 [Candidatus Cyclobacteriaceae bacterium M2_1C_046]